MKILGSGAKHLKKSHYKDLEKDYFCIDYKNGKIVNKQNVYIEKKKKYFLTSFSTIIDADIEDEILTRIDTKTYQNIGLIEAYAQDNDGLMLELEINENDIKIINSDYDDEFLFIKTGKLEIKKDYEIVRDGVGTILEIKEITENTEEV